MRLKIKFALVINICLVLLIANVAVATPITVDGNPAEWPPASLLASATTGSVADPDVAISAVYFTNDTTNMYWRIETSSATDWNEAGVVALCLGTEVEADVPFGPCTSDYTLVIDPVLGTTLLVDNSSSHTDTSTGISMAVDGTTTEISIALADVHITSASCPIGCTVSASITVDSALADGALGAEFTDTTFTTSPQVGTGSPTSVTVTNFTAQVSGLGEQNRWTGVWLAASVLVLLVVAVIWKRMLYKKSE